MYAENNDGTTNSKRIANGNMHVSVLFNANFRDKHMMMHQHIS